MDLAEIRKKARTQSPIVSKSIPLQNALIPIQSETQVQPFAQQVLDHFWSEMGVEKVSTEEEYTQTLTDTISVDEASQIQWLGFYLGKEEYALDIEVVSELIKPRTLTELPYVPEYVCGIITLRGEVIPVVDLVSRLGLVHEGYDDIDLKRIVVCEGREQRVGLLVDRISQVVRLSADEIEKPQFFGDNPATAFISGIGRKHGRSLIQLHPEKVIDIEKGLTN
ncbi:chemotaxis protein CheW [Geopsychrobacter electrodiphilus]|uniref:chemotaxis protein CheW n=1 Tax=Geopsychrobacter electrodiphilus TaxID=225196 RepID=UPI00035F116D|nr:chemotaxis protein CheW [Geopsychrobacter electrodiphilus]